MDVAEIVVEQSGEVILRLPMKGASMTVGRDPQCDLHLDNKALSRRHAQLERRGAAIWVRDLNSQNGTKLNGQPISAPQALRGGDVIELGRYKIRLEGVEEATSDTPVLTLTGPDGKSHAFGMVEAEVVIGRAPSCDISVNDKNISRRHVRVTRQGDGFVAEDLGSQNGTLVGGRKILGPTPFRVGEPVNMGQYVIVATFMSSTNAAGAPKSGRTMVFDRSELHKAAYIGGDAGNDDDQQSVSVGGESEVRQRPNMDEDSDEDETRGVDGPIPVPVPPPPPPKAARPAPLPPPPGARAVPPAGLPATQDSGVHHAARPPSPPAHVPAVAQPAAAAPAAVPAPLPQKKSPAAPRPNQPPWATVSHPDLGGERPMLLDKPVTFIPEDGGDDYQLDGRMYAPQAALMLVRTAAGVVASVVGDRRAVVVNGEPVVAAELNDGDVVDLGVLRVVFRRAGS
jgi:pSer/pThr/pTyr-binding forkhead associated (FHA) protein